MKRHDYSPTGPFICTVCDRIHDICAICGLPWRNRWHHDPQ